MTTDSNDSSQLLSNENDIIQTKDYINFSNMEKDLNGLYGFYEHFFD